ncbi:Scr1 family TA system antitoxin-like transcriptional regulator [Kitasatospora sp. NPDC056327]|uniref:helix-turn-helix domain-containing protein n=1 Tax=Kitasatospora sp. NPDC056327 TaxID=3345785 RepID=UPI0035D76B41
MGDAFNLSSQKGESPAAMNRKELDPDSSPTARFGMLLRQAREARSWTQEQLGALVGYSAVHISAVETGRKPPTGRFARRIDDAFETDRFEREWRQSEQRFLFEGFDQYTVKERESVTVRIFELDMVPGLLQHPDYSAAYEMAPVRRGDATREQAEERLKVLVDRQRLLDRSVTVHAVLDESALRRRIGGAAVMARQMQHLEDLAARPLVILQVVPCALGESRPFSHSVTLLTLPTRAMVGYTETLGRGLLERDSEVVARWAGQYDRLQVDALTRLDSVAMIRETRRDYEQHSR